MKVLILGHKGMLGHMVDKLLTSKGIEVEKIFVTKKNRWPSSNLKNDIKSFKGDYIINCLGSIPQRTDDFNVNYELPIWLEKNTTPKIIHPGTDCEINSDGYGISKKRARDFIINEGAHTKIIKGSFIGPEIDTQANLMQWFLSQTGEVNGYSECYWNGNTTLTWAKFCLHLMENWDSEDIETILEGERVSKYHLLLMLKEVYGKHDITINPINEPTMDKCLKGKIKTPKLIDQLKDMKYFYNINS